MLDSEKDRYLAEGIKMLIKSQYDKIVPEDSKEWLEKFDEVFPEHKPFGGPIDEITKD